MFNKQELQVILQMFQRVQITGQEAETVVLMKQKIVKELEKMETTKKVADGIAKTTKKRSKK